MLEHPETVNGLSNHHPMVVSALRQLQASGSVQAQYETRVQKKVQYAELDSKPLSQADALALRGQKRRYAAIFTYFDTALSQQPVSQVLEHWVPILAPALSTAAYHPVIRLGHGLADDNRSEIAAGLAYWVWAYQRLPWPSTSENKQADLPGVLRHLLTGTDWPEQRLGGATFSESFLNVIQHPAYATLVFKPRRNQLSLADIEQAAIQLHWTYNNFALLHGVTGTQAVRRLGEHLSRPDVLLPFAWQALVVTWLSQGLRWREPETPMNNPDQGWDKIIQHACDSLDDHKIKLVACCNEYFQRTGNRLYWQVAATAVA
nr:questin oxidase family protein [Saccharospirillum impatiens]